jgi:TIGR03009 family protein
VKINYDNPAPIAFVGRIRFSPDSRRKFHRRERVTNPPIQGRTRAFMLRQFAVGRAISLLFLLAAPGIASIVFAQDETPRSAGDGGGRIARDGLTVPDLRRPAAEPADPEMEAVLEKWSAATQQIRKLQGTHLRAIIDYAVGTETRAQGKFYVETPDKGRIDVEKYSGPNPKPGTKKKAVDPSGKTVELIVESHKHAERWICDGKQIKVIDDDRKTIQVVPIPEKQQGSNLMDSPLPFLFGMPPQKAKQRYRFQLKGKDEKKNLYQIEVRPRTKLDAAEWIKALLVLDGNNHFLPVFVRLYSPAGTKETIYIFKDLEVNRIQLFFWNNPFNPMLFGTYHREVHDPGEAGPRNPTPTGLPKTAQSIDDGIAPMGGSLPEPNGPRMPLLLDSPFDKKMRDRISSWKSQGYDVKIERGSRAKTEEDVYRVQDQMPDANTPLHRGDKIILRLFDRMAEIQKTSKPASE